MSFKPVSEMDDDEKSASLRTMLKTRQSLEEAVAFLAGEEASFSTTTEDLKRIRIERADLEAKLSKLNQKLNAFQAGTGSLSPPTPETVEKVCRLADEIGQLTFEGKKADQVISAAHQVVKIFGITKT